MMQCGFKRPHGHDKRVDSCIRYEEDPKLTLSRLPLPILTLRLLFESLPEGLWVLGDRDE